MSNASKNHAGHPQNYTHLWVGGVPTLLHIKSMCNVQCHICPLQNFGFTDNWDCTKKLQFYPQDTEAGTSLLLGPLYSRFTPTCHIPSWNWRLHLPQWVIKSLLISFMQDFNSCKQSWSEGSCISWGVPPSQAHTLMWHLWQILYTMDFFFNEKKKTQTVSPVLCQSVQFHKDFSHSIFWVSLKIIFKKNQSA